MTQPRLRASLVENSSSPAAIAIVADGRIDQCAFASVLNAAAIIVFRVAPDRALFHSQHSAFSDNTSPLVLPNFRPANTPPAAPLAGPSVCLDKGTRHIDRNPAAANAVSLVVYDYTALQVARRAGLVSAVSLRTAYRLEEMGIRPCLRSPPMHRSVCFLDCGSHGPVCRVMRWPYYHVFLRGRGAPSSVERWGGLGISFGLHPLALFSCRLRAPPVIWRDRRA